MQLPGWQIHQEAARYYLVVNSALFICFSILSGLAKTLTVKTTN